MFVFLVIFGWLKHKICLIIPQILNNIVNTIETSHQARVCLIFVYEINRRLTAKEKELGNKNVLLVYEILINHIKSGYKAKPSMCI